MKTATNPQTGKTVYWDGQAWLPLQTATHQETGEVIGIVEGETFTITPPRPREPESIREMIAETPERFQETRERYRGLAGDVERLPGKFRVNTTLAAGVGAAGETLGEVAGEAYRRYAPEPVQEFVSEAYEGSMLQRGMEKLGEVAQAYPEEATTTEALLNFAGAGPKIGYPSFPRPSASIRMASKEAQDALLEEERKAVADSLLPEDYVKAPGKIEPTGAMNRNVYVPSPSEDNVIDYLAGLPEYKGDRNPAVNATVVDSQLAKHEADLQLYIKNSAKNPKTKTQPLFSKLEELKTQFHNTDEYVELMPDAQQKVNLFIDTAIKRLQEKATKKGTVSARDILEVRRQLDKQIFRKKPKAGLENPDLSSAKEVAGKYVRDELNQAFLGLMPDDQAYRLINGMAMLFRAKNLLDVKAGKAINQTMLGRTVKGIEDFSGLRFPTTPLALGATAAAGTAALGGLPTVSAIIGGGSALVVLGRLARKRRRTAILRELIMTTDRMIQGANVSVDTMATLRADKVMLAQMLNEVNQEPENEQ